MPFGEEILVERGVNLSGGQKSVGISIPIN